MSHNYLNKSRTQELINTIRGHLSDIATVLSNLASGDARDNTKAPIDHTQASNTVTSMTGYSKPASTSAIAATDTLNEAIGKLEKGLEDAGGGGDLAAHIATHVEDSNGVHGIRCHNGALEVWNEYTQTWCDPSELGWEIGNVSNLAVTKGYLSLTITWNDPADTANATWAGTKLVMGAGTYPESVTDGTLLVNSTTRDAYATNGYTINNLTDGTTYYFKLFPYTNKGTITNDNVNRISETAEAVTVLGLEADFENGTFTRLENAVGLSGGSDFDNFTMYRRRRCNLADDGTINAYLGDETYAEDGTNGQVMVEQPKFWYKVEPITLDGTKIRKAKYYIADKQKDGFKLHPAFIGLDGTEKDYVYEGAYEADQAMYKGNLALFSRSGKTPGNNTPSRSSCRTSALNRGTHWRQNNVQIVCMDALLMAIEYGQFDMQSAIGYGRCSSGALNTGTLNYYGNGTYGSKNDYTTAVQWRGKENPWGNIREWVDGINIYNKDPYIADTYSYVDSTSSGYTYAGFTLPSPQRWCKIKAFGYNSTYDWLFLGAETIGRNVDTPINDEMITDTNQSWKAAVSGGGYNENHTGPQGPFYWNITNSSVVGMTGSRLIYIL